VEEQADKARGREMAASLGCGVMEARQLGRGVREARQRWRWAGEGATAWGDAGHREGDDEVNEARSVGTTRSAGLVGNR
jgi:hypothetical protein